ncbi:MAG: carbohydrate binding family 9 domain-containing protein [Saprospirales bacterium]|nr:carbohydrate binding family 9 domain-containing protein [Saprospirales bacterium]
MKTIFTCLSFLLLISFQVFGQNGSTEIAKKQYHTRSLGNETIQLDGILDEPVWNTVEWGADFVEFQPNENTPPAEPSQFKILFSEKYLYIGYRAFDSAPDSLVARLSRRDEFPGEWMEINIDSYHDLRTAFSFTFSVSGVRGDEFVTNNGDNWDSSWNPIWDGKAHIDSLGWTAEVKIPFSQLRYGKQAEPVWGIQVMRRNFRREERSTWQYIPQNAGVWVSGYGELHGLRNLPTNKQVELAPYVVARTERFEKEEGNPFADGSRNGFSAGIDGKVAVTRDMILDFTVNPDFGQVEADPGAVRLDGYEVFFQERRPFFVESRNLFDYQLTGSAAGGEYDADLLFYSRRIGGAPHGRANLQVGEFVDQPQQTSILGAAKFSGKTAKGLSLGILESITKKEYAEIDHAGERRDELVEPLTSYFVGRVLQDYQEGNTIFGGVFTAVNRGEGLDFLRRNAYSGGLDFQRFWKNRWWFMKANVQFSKVDGTPEAILDTQTGFVHYFQRPNATHLSVDSTRTSLTGTGGTFKIGKIGGKGNEYGGLWKFETGLTWRSPQLELNDVGFLLAADEINHFTWVSYNIQKPFSIFRNLRINYNHWARWDFGGQFLYSAFNTNAHAWFNNNWRMGSGFTLNPNEISNNALRGGSSLRRPPGMGTFLYVESDSRKKLIFSTNTSFAWGFGETVRYQYVNAGLTWQLIDALRISLYPEYDRSWRKQDQYVAQTEYNGDLRTVVSEVEQRSLALTMRINFNITPDLTVQYYGQPFIFRALYQNYGYVTDPLAKEYDRRFHPYTASEISQVDNTFSIDENGDGHTDYQFGQPDFNFIQFRSNMVVRWEYIPGSEIYLVWSQGAFPDAYGDLETPLHQSLFGNVFDGKPKPTNIFLVKVTYRFLN